MRTKHLISALLLIVPFFMTARVVADDLSKVTTQQIRQQPRTVMKNAREKLSEALQRGNSQDIIAALVQESASQLYIDEDSMPAVTGRISQVVDLCKQEADKSILRLFLADLYMRHYNHNTYKIHSRSYIPDNKDMETWATLNYCDTIEALLSLSLYPSEVLKATPMSDYRHVMEVSQEDMTHKEAWRQALLFNPTLYDYVVRRAIVLYSDMTLMRSLQKSGKRPDMEPFYASADVFMRDTLPQGVGSPDIWRLYKGMLTAHAGDKSQEAFFMWNLERLEYAHRQCMDESLYCRSLEQLMDDYANKDYVIEAVIDWAHLQTDKNEYNELRQAYDALNRWIERYPHYYRASNLREICRTMTYAHVRAAVPQVLYPDIETKVEIEYKNAHRINYTLIRCTGISPLENIPYLDDRRARGEEVVSGKVALSDTLTFVLHQDVLSLPALVPGCYALKMDADGKDSDVLFFTVSRYMILSLSSSSDMALLLVVDSRSGAPAVGVPVVLYDNNDNRVAAAVTDTMGICRMAIEMNRSYRAFVMDGEDRFAPPVTEYRQEFSQSSDKNVSLFTDRSVYRPGQKLYFSAIVYRLADGLREVMPQAQVLLILEGANADELWCDTLVTDRYGSVHGEILLPEDVLTGTWRLSAGVMNGDDCDAEDSRSLMVSEYKRPQFEVSCNSIKGSFSFGDTVTVTGKAITFSGVPLPQADVAYTVVRQPLYWGWYGGSSQTVTEGVTQTDSQGNFSLDFLAEAAVDEPYARYAMMRFSVEVTVTSSTGESQKDETSVVVSDASIYIEMDMPTMVRCDKAHDIAISVKNSDGNNVPVAVDFSLYRLADGEMGTSLDKLKIEGDAVWTAKLPAGVANLSLPWSSFASGAYRCVARAVDMQGRPVEQTAYFVLYRTDDTCPPISTPLWIPETEQTVKPGETAHVAVGSSLKDASLFYAVANGEEMVSYGRVKLNNSMAVIEIPYLSQYGTSLHIALALVRDGVVYQGAQLSEYGQFVYSGGVDIQRQEPDYKLTIVPETFRDKTQPGSHETWRFTVRDAAGNPVDALFMAELYDASLDALYKHQWTFNPVYRPFGRNVVWKAPWRQGSDVFFYAYYATVEASYKTPSVPYIILNTYGLNNMFSVLDGMIYGVRSNSMMRSMSVADYAEASAELDEVVVTMGTIEEKKSAYVEEEKMLQQDVKQVEYRENLAETAFFYPHLVTDKKGCVALEFTLPDVNTTWNFFSLAVTPALLNGRFDAKVISSKPLMVAPNMPRFVRQGDKMQLSLAVQNTTDTLLSGRAYVMLYNPENEQELYTDTLPFDAQAHATATVQFDIEVSESLSVMGVRVGAATPLYADGEQQLVAILPASAMVTEAMPFYIGAHVTDTTIVFDAMEQQMSRPSLRNKRVTLEYCDNPVWYAVTALPPLAENCDNSATSVMASLYANVAAHGIAIQNKMIVDALREWQASAERGEKPLSFVSQLEQNKELKQLLLQQTPWVLDAVDNTSRLSQLASLLDTERSQRLAVAAVRRLQEMQLTSGGWGWYEYMPSSFFITLNVLEGFSRLSVWGDMPYDADVADMEMKALRYVDNELVRIHNRYPSQTLSYDELIYLYVRSAYRDVPIAGATLALHKQLINLVIAEWHKYSEIEKAYAAIALFRYGYEKEAHAIIESLREYALTTPSQGMFWANNRSRSFYRNSAVQAQCAIYNAFEEIDPRTAELDAMRQWLLMQKQTQMWANVPSTLDAVAVLLTSGSDWVVEGRNTRITWGDTRLPEPVAVEQTLGYEKFLRSGDAIYPSDARVVISDHAAHPSWGALYWQYEDKLGAIEASGNEQIRVERSYFTRCDGMLVPVDATSLKMGDIVLVRMVLYIDRDMQYVTLTDSRPACFEPVEPLPQYVCGEGVCYYREPSDAVTAFHVDFLPRGKRVIEYEVYVDRAGTYQAGVATLASYYAPQYTAHSAGVSFTVE